MTDESAVPMTREQVEREMTRWLEDKEVTDFLSRQATNPNGKRLLRAILAQSFVTDLFDNAEQIAIAKLEASARADIELDKEMEAAHQADSHRGG